MVGITHIVLFQFKAEASAEAILNICGQMLSLGEKCVSATTNEAYIKSIVGGINNSPEDHKAGITHGFTVEFASVEDRNYYVREDPAHKAFVNIAGEIVEKVIVVDFSPGCFDLGKSHASQ